MLIKYDIMCYVRIAPVLVPKVEAGNQANVPKVKLG